MPVYFYIPIFILYGMIVQRHNFFITFILGTLLLNLSACSNKAIETPPVLFERALSLSNKIKKVPKFAEIKSGGNYIYLLDNVILDGDGQAGGFFALNKN